jgi:uncharacterized integral membrane protein
MVYVKRFLLLALAALLGIFAFQNQHFLSQPVTLAFFKYSATLMLGFWLILTFMTGVLLFLCIDLPRTFSLKRELARKSGDLARAQFELGRIQAQAAEAQAASAAVLPLPSAPATAVPRSVAGDLEKRLGV